MKIPDPYELECIVTKENPKSELRIHSTRCSMLSNETTFNKWHRAFNNKKTHSYIIRSLSFLEVKYLNCVLHSCYHERGKMR